MRFGELTELRRKDIDVEAGVVFIQRAVVHVDGKAIVGDPKTEAGIRKVHIPPHVLPAVLEHLELHVGPEMEALLFPARQGGHMVVGSCTRSTTRHGRKPVDPTCASTISATPGQPYP